MEEHNKRGRVKESGSCPLLGRQTQSSGSGYLSSRALGLSTNRSTSYVHERSKRQEKKKMKRNANKAFLPKKPIQRREIQTPPLLVQGRPYGDSLDNVPIPFLPYGKMLPVPLSQSTSMSSLSHTTAGESDTEKRHIDVIVRIRPKNQAEEQGKTIVWKTSDKTLIFDPKEKDSDFFYKGKRQSLRSDFGKKRPNKNLAFSFDHVYGQDCSNFDIFNASLKGLVSKVMAGFNCTVFAYGATGSGKTYTMLGSQEMPGMTVLMAEELFKSLEALDDECMSYDIKVTYLEVYNETIKDLLNPHNELHIREDGKQGLQIPGITEQWPTAASDLLYLLREGNSYRTQHATDYNEESSRSHAIFEVTLLLHQNSPTDKFKIRTTSTRLTMVDLAGSEKGGLSVTDGLRQQEGSNINKSLLALSSCINALVEKKLHIPYRNSKLTRLLKDSFSGNCITVMITNVSPTESCFEDTHNSLHYAYRAKHIKVQCKRNPYSENLCEGGGFEASNTIFNLQNKIRVLTEELSDERRRHQNTTKQLLEFQASGVGAGDGDGPRANLPPVPKSKPSSSIALQTLTDPAAVDKFFHLLTTKSKISLALADSLVQEKLSEWRMTWEKQEMDTVDCFGRPEISDPRFIAFTKLRNSQSDLSVEFSKHAAQVDTHREDLLDVKKAMQRIQQSSLASLNNDAPFAACTFEEVVRNKENATQVEILDKQLRFYQQLNSSIFHELRKSHVHRLNCLSLVKDCVRNDTTKDKSEVMENLRAALTPVYDPHGHMRNAHVPQPVLSHPRSTINLQEDWDKLETIIQRPILTISSNALLKLSSPHKRDTTISPVTNSSSRSDSHATISVDDNDVKCVSTTRVLKKMKKHLEMAEKPIIIPSASSSVEIPIAVTKGESSHPVSNDDEETESSWYHEEVCIQMPSSSSSGHETVVEMEVTHRGEMKSPNSKLYRSRRNGHSAPLSLSPKRQKCRGESASSLGAKKNTERASTVVLLHRGDAVTDLVQEQETKTRRVTTPPRIDGKPPASRSRTKEIGNHPHQPSRLPLPVVSDHKSKTKCKTPQRNSKPKPLPLLALPRPTDDEDGEERNIRPYTFCYEDDSSTSSVEESQE